MRLNRLGRFQIAITDDAMQPEGIMQLMAQCIVLRAEMLYESQSIHYTAHSEMFDVVSTGQIIPMYVIIIHNHPEGRKTFSAKRVEEPKVSPYYY
ncbi:MAG TPA: hypothetical protein PLJ29_01750 [Leptospiraceae bacterium]|nr:hypothetical protein [Leptospiraceae bacterium]HNI25052.1 hypothetical protein [Leptospiraceae bacterium]